MRGIAAAGRRVRKAFAANPVARQELRRMIQSDRVFEEGQTGVAFSFGVSQALSNATIREYAETANAIVGVVAPNADFENEVEALNRDLPEGKKIVYAKDRASLVVELKKHGAKQTIYFTLGEWEKALALEEGYGDAHVFNTHDLDRFRLFGGQAVMDAIENYRQVSNFLASMA